MCANYGQLGVSNLNDIWPNQLQQIDPPTLPEHGQRPTMSFVGGGTWVDVAAPFLAAFFPFPREPMQDCLKDQCRESLEQCSIHIL